MHSSFLTVDLEDYKHATMKDMGLDPLSDGDQIRRGLDRLFHAVQKVQGSKKMTFFTTGQVARLLPALVHDLAADGHEIACHGDEHENVCNLTRAGFEQNLEKAVKSLEDASGRKIRGFRAPNFSINASCPWAYEVLSDFDFRYDSSRIQGHPRQSAEPYEVISLKKPFHIFPLYEARWIGGLKLRVIGGTYFRLLPAFVILKLMKQAVQAGYLPILYLHPADLDDQFRAVSKAEMAGLPLWFQWKWALHQKLWAFGIDGTAKKIETILKEFPNRGCLLDALSHARAGLTCTF